MHEREAQEPWNRQHPPGTVRQTNAESDDRPRDDQAADPLEDVDEIRPQQARLARPLVERLLRAIRSNVRPGLKDGGAGGQQQGGGRSGEFGWPVDEHRIEPARKSGRGCDPEGDEDRTDAGDAAPESATLIRRRVVLMCRFRRRRHGHTLNAARVRAFRTGED